MEGLPALPTASSTVGLRIELGTPVLTSFCQVPLMAIAVLDFSVYQSEVKR